VKFFVPARLARFGRSCEGLVELREPLLDLAGERQSFGDQAETKRVEQALSGRACRGNPATHPTDAIGALSLVQRCPSKVDVGERKPQWEAVFPRDCRVLVR
jgi:hypothetical protein